MKYGCYDIHITVQCSDKIFVRYGSQLDFKPIIIFSKGAKCEKQLIATKQVIFKNNKDAIIYCKLFSNLLKSVNLIPIRLKVERQGCWNDDNYVYYEMHWISSGNNIDEYAHSINLLKPEKQYLTIREKNFFIFKKKLNLIKNSTLDIESVIYDTNIKLDEGWL